jgi:hypothetical protein
MLKLGYLEKGQKYLGSFEMRCWRRTEKIIWVDRVKKNQEVLQKVKEEKNPSYNKKREG